MIIQCLWLHKGLRWYNISVNALVFSLNHSLRQVSLVLLLMKMESMSTGSPNRKPTDDLFCRDVSTESLSITLTHSSHTAGVFSLGTTKIIQKYTSTPPLSLLLTRMRPEHSTRLLFKMSRYDFNAFQNVIETYIHFFVLKHCTTLFIRFFIWT